MGLKKKAKNKSKKSSNYKSNLSCINWGRQLNDMDYKSNQNELKLKKLNDEKLRTKREALERELESCMQDLD